MLSLLWLGLGNQDPSSHTMQPPPQKKGKKGKEIKHIKHSMWHGTQLLKLRHDLKVTLRVVMSVGL